MDKLERIELIDLELLNDVISLDSNFASTLLELLEDQTRLGIRQLDNLLACNRLWDVSRLSNKLKGSSAALGFMRLRHCFDCIQQIAQLQALHGPIPTATATSNTPAQSNRPGNQYRMSSTGSSPLKTLTSQPIKDAIQDDSQAKTTTTTTNPGQEDILLNIMQSDSPLMMELPTTSHAFSDSSLIGQQDSKSNATLPTRRPTDSFNRNTSSIGSNSSPTKSGLKTPPAGSTLPGQQKGASPMPAQVMNLKSPKMGSPAGNSQSSGCGLLSQRDAVRQCQQWLLASLDVLGKSVKRASYLIESSR